MHASSRQGEFGLAPPNSIVHTGSTALGDTLGAPDGRVVGLEEGDGVANGDVLGVTVLPKVVHPPLAGAEAQNHARYSLHAADDGSATQAAAKQGESDAAPKSVKQSPTLGEGLGAALGAALGNAVGDALGGSPSTRTMRLESSVRDKLRRLEQLRLRPNCGDMPATLRIVRIMNVRPSSAPVATNEKIGSSAQLTSTDSIAHPPTNERT